MTGHRPFDQLLDEMAPERRAVVEDKAKALRSRLPLDEFNLAQGLARRALGRSLEVDAPVIAQMERRADLYLAELRSHIEAMGGTLHIVASFPEGDVAVTQFSEASDAKV